MLDIGATTMAVDYRDHSGVTLGYFSGSDHHEADFAQISLAVIALMRAYPNILLMVGLKISVCRELELFRARL